ncbi:MAG: hypothetical protein BIFFINMI_03767 [Phycisphaerae bacterium]|nr:hypothetical protein [Phycisphaerae bacterium]
MAITTRPMTDADLDFAMRMKDQARWNQLPADWRRFLSFDPGGCFVALDDATPVGTGVVTTYGRQLAWIGMIIVDETRRRSGIGRTIMNACIDYARGRGTEVVGLDATPLGNKLYLTLGFTEHIMLDRREGTGGVYDSHGVQPLGEADLPAVVAYDAPIFGVSRPQVLEALYVDHPAVAFAARDKAGRLTGYILGRHGQNATQIGPWAADDAATAEQLFRAALNAIGPAPVFFDILAVNPSVLPLVSRYGFRHQRPFVRMYLGENLYPGQPLNQFAIAGVEMG